MQVGRTVWGVAQQGSYPVYPVGFPSRTGPTARDQAIYMLAANQKQRYEPAP